ncbi:MAG: hypothetical protein ACPG7F_11660, partial [Aggregatilineales bacterium]
MQITGFSYGAMMTRVTFKPDHTAFDDYYAVRANLQAQGATTEGELRRAFSNLLVDAGKLQKWTLVEERIRKANNSNRNIHPDGTLLDKWNLAYGYWEAKDGNDDLEAEIIKKRQKGYPFTNIIFEDTQQAVLYQDGMRITETPLTDREGVARLLTEFLNYESAPFQEFEKAVDYFKGEIPQIATGLKERIDDAH